MSAESFFDSNVILYTFDKVDLRKRNTAVDLVAGALEDASGVISYQVVQEVLNVLTRKVDPAMNGVEAIRFLDATLAPLWRVQPSPELYRSGLAIRVRYQCSFYDSMIVAAALQAGCSRVLTEDLQHGQVIQGLTIENPFAQ